MTGQIISQIVRLQFYIVTYLRENKYSSEHIVQKRSSQYKERQQRCDDTQRQSIDKKIDYKGRNSNI